VHDEWILMSLRNFEGFSQASLTIRILDSSLKEIEPKPLIRKNANERGIIRDYLGRGLMTLQNFSARLKPCPPKNLTAQD
jgi:hypothetical protein